MSRKLFAYFFMVVLLIGLSSCYKEVTLYNSEPTNCLELPVLLKLDGKDCFFDSELNMLRYSISTDSLSNFSPIVEFTESSEFYFDTTKLMNYQSNQLGNVQIGKPYSLKIRSHGTEKDLDLIFTNLPIVQVISDSRFYDEPKCLARINMERPGAKTGFTSYAGIEIRGGYSRGFDKKSLGFSLWSDMTSTSNYSYGMLGLNNNSQWILTSAIIDPSRIRNLVSIKLWNSLNQPEISKTGHLGVESTLVEVFINNSFNGVYTFSEQLNTEFLNLGNEALLYKAIDWADGGTTFNSCGTELSKNHLWNGWELEISDAREQPNWKPLSDLSHLVFEGSEIVFFDSIAKMVELDVAIDYFLLLNLTSAFDNVGKNTLMLKENTEAPFLIIPWDLDGSWGILYDGTRTGHEAILGNNLYDRLYKINPGNFRQKVKERWQYLRHHQFRKENLFHCFDTCFQMLNASDVIQKENLVWNLNLDMTEEQDYLEDWISRRLIFLDQYFQKY